MYSLNRNPHLMSKRISSYLCAYNISLVFIGLMFLLPFVIMHHHLPIPVFYAEWIAGAMGLAAAFPLIIKALNPAIKIPQTALIFPSITAILALQWMLGMLHSTQYALLVFSYLAWAFLLVVLGSHLRQKLGWEKVVSTLAWFLVIAGIINVGIVTLQIVVRTGGTISFLPYLSEYGSISQPNHFANFIALATASLIYLYTKKRFSLSFFMLMLVCFLAMLSFSGSRSSWLYLAAITVLSVALQTNAIRQQTNSAETRNLLHISILLLPIFVLVQLFTYYVLPNELANLPTERLINAANADTPSARLHIWFDSLRLFLQSPWIGNGAGSIRIESFLLLDRPAAMASGHVFENAHNLFLHLLTEMGLGGFLIVLVSLAIWFRAFKWRKLNSESWWLMALITVIGIHSMLEYPIWFAYFLGIAAFLLGMGDEKFVSISKSTIISKLSNRFNRKLTYSGLILVLLLGILNLTTMFIANMKLENWFQQWAHNSAQQDRELDWVDHYSLLSPYAELMYALPMNTNLVNIDEKVLLSKSAMHFKPLRRIVYQHALLLDLQGDHTNAVKQLNRALTAYPGNFTYELNATPLEYRQSYLNLLSEAKLTMPNKTTTD